MRTALVPPAILAYDLADLERDVASIRTIKRAAEIVGGLSAPSKMPGWSYNLPASRCLTGSVLRHKQGSTCFKCYAGDDIAWQKQGGRMQVVDGKLRGSRYAMKSTTAALQRRFATLTDPLWVPAMVTLLRKYRETWFRWHDSGDVQSAEHLYNIGCVATATPACRHWLPTREAGICREAAERFGPAPANLLIRASGTMINGHRPRWPHASLVSTGPAPAGAHGCPAPTQGNSCGSCRACWDPAVPTVVYHVH